jgi:hypothetical protein
MDNSFVDHVLSWDENELLDHPNEIKPRIANFIAKRYNNYTPDNSTPYLHRFVPSLLEDAKAIIASGLQKEAEDEGKSDVSLCLAKKVEMPERGNFWILNFAGTLSNESGYTMNVVLLKRKTIRLLAIASDFPDDPHVTCQCLINATDYSANFHTHFVANSKWNVTHLGSLLIHRRIFDMCTSLSSTPLLENVARGTSATFNNPPAMYFSPHRQQLNEIQNRSIGMFLCMPRDNVMTLQGPPGTGKTSTLTVLLAELHERLERTLVCAPSNKAVQVLADRYLKEHPDARIVLSAVVSNVRESLIPISLQSIMASIESHCMEINIILLDIDRLIDKEITELGPLKRRMNKLRMSLNAIDQLLLRYQLEGQSMKVLTDQILAIDDENH